VLFGRAILINKNLIDKGRLLRGLTTKAISLSVAAFLVLFSAGAYSAEIVIGPVLEFPGTNEMSIFWETDVPMKGGVILLDGESGEKIFEPSAKGSTYHRVKLTGLLPKTEYEYSILGDGASLYKEKFTTLPEKGDYRVVLIGDIHAPQKPFFDLAPLMDAQSPDFIILLGDLVYEGDNKHEWVPLFQMGRKLFDHIPLFSIVGDHDCNGETGTYFYDIFFTDLKEGLESPKYFKANITGDLFIFLDVMSDKSNVRQWIWFVKTLVTVARAPDVGRVFVLSHEGVISFKGNRRGYSLFKRFLGIMDFAGVSALFSGHDHHFVTGKTYNEIDFFVSGGGGGALYDLNPDNFFAKFVGKMEKSYKGYHFLVMDVSDEGFIVRVVDDNGAVIYTKEVAEPR
jgi:Calcineurin-like phosphoesterase